MSDMVITLVQTALHWENKEQNRVHLASLLSNIEQPTDVVMLPEMFSTGFSMNTSIAETMDGKTIQWMKEQAIKASAAICGSLMVEFNGTYFNRFIWMNPDGTFHTYDKRHLFRMGNEHQHYTAGTSRIIIDYKGWKLFPVICYDLRFPVWLRRTEELNYDAMLIVANWPERRQMHWKTLLQARAIENQCYVAALNRVGEDGHGVYHSGNSGLISPKGDWLTELQHETLVRNVVLSKVELIEWRATFPAANDADRFSIDLY
jgi:omega-amidase